MSIQCSQDPQFTVDQWVVIFHQIHGGYELIHLSWIISPFCWLLSRLITNGSERLLPTPSFDSAEPFLTMGNYRCSIGLLTDYCKSYLISAILLLADSRVQPKKNPTN